MEYLSKQLLLFGSMLHEFYTGTAITNDDMTHAKHIATQLEIIFLTVIIFPEISISIVYQDAR